MANDRVHTIHYEGRDYEARAGEPLLDELLRGGANVAFSCRRGTCQVCMLQVHEGDAGPEASADLREELREAGLVLPCRAKVCGDLALTKPDPSTVAVKLHVIEREPLTPTITRLRLMAESDISWRAGQFVNLAHPSGALRSYSVASLHELGEPIELHVRRHEGGLVSTWLCDELAVGDTLDMWGLSGTCYYDPQLRERELLLVAGGTGLAPLLGIARAALEAGHTGPITLLHGSSRPEGIYERERLLELQREHQNFRYQAWVDDAEGATLDAHLRHGQVVDAAFPEDRSGVVLYLAGPPAMVHEARVQAVLAGVDRRDTYADPFEDGRPYMPDDSAKVSSIDPDPELWAALDEGPGLTRILSEFYVEAFEDPRLAPFFVNVNQQRVREKQYEFLSDLFTGKRHYFGARPFNAHHQMIISDELFDYREQRVEAIMRRHGLAEHLIRRWLAVHERFRPEIVKTRPRGMVIEGIEQTRAGFADEVLEIATLCDGCHAPLEVGTVARHNLQSGDLFCSECWKA